MSDKYKVYVEDGECRLFVFPDSPYDWSREPGTIHDAPDGCTPENTGLHDLEYDPAANAVKRKETP